MDEQPNSAAPAREAERKTHGPTWYLAWLLLLPALYVLSIGPVTKYYRSRNTIPHAVIVLYRPLDSLASRSQAVNALLAWYIGTVWHASRPYQ